MCMEAIIVLFVTLCPMNSPNCFRTIQSEYSSIDECYIDLYPSSGDAPVGLIECCDLTNPSSRAVVFHSLSKRSNLAGLRSGFVSANEKVITKLL